MSRPCCCCSFSCSLLGVPSPSIHWLSARAPPAAVESYVLYDSTPYKRATSLLIDHPIVVHLLRPISLCPAGSPCPSTFLLARRFLKRALMRPARGVVGARVMRRAGNRFGPNRERKDKVVLKQSKLRRGLLGGLLSGGLLSGLNRRDYIGHWRPTQPGLVDHV